MVLNSLDHGPCTVDCKLAKAVQRKTNSAATQGRIQAQTQSVSFSNHHTKVCYNFKIQVSAGAVSADPKTI